MLGADDASPARGRRPNIVVIRTDDMDSRSMTIRRPGGALALENVDALLARRGVTFRNSFVSFPVCSPSRATFLTGQYAHNHGVRGNDPPDGGYGALDHSNTLPVWLASAGYYNVHIGKYLNGYPATQIPPGWAEWYTTLVSRYFDYTINENGTLVHYGYAADDYNTDVLTRKAEDFIRSGNAGGRPFFLVVDYIAPHKTSPPALNTGSLPLPAPRHQGAFGTYRPVWPPSFDEADVSDKPSFVRSLPRLDRSDVLSIVVLQRARLETLLAVDEGVARILRALEISGDLADTWIFFTSDNGFMQGEHRISTGKDVAYEESIRVPLVVRGPGVAPGRDVEGIVGNVDLAPTIVALTGAVPGRTMDGRSLVPLLLGLPTDWREDLLLEAFGVLPWRGIRDRRSTFVEYDLDQDGAAEEREYYEFEPGPCFTGIDPWELESAHRDPCVLPEIRRRHARAQALADCSGESCR